MVQKVQTTITKGSNNRYKFSNNGSVYFHEGIRWCQTHGGNMFNNTAAALEAINTQLKLLREDNERMKASIQTMTKHIKFLVHTVKVVNPELKDPTE